MCGEVVLAATGVGTEGTFERLHALVDPDVLLQVRVGAQERSTTVRALVRFTT